MATHPRFVVVGLVTGLVMAAQANAQGTTDLISSSIETGRAVGGTHPSVDATGRFVLFDSASPELVTGDTRGHSDVFVHDRATGRNVRISVGAGGRELNAPAWRGWLTSNARYALFNTSATNVLVDGPDTWVSQGYLRDLQAGTQECVTVSNAGVPARQPGALALEASESGTVVLFASTTDNLVAGTTFGVHRLYVRDRLTSQTSLVGPAAAETRNGRLSGDGRFVAFSTLHPIASPDLDNGHEAYVKDLATGRYEVVSRNSSGARANGSSVPYDISHDGRYVLFGSEATNLVPNDTNGRFDLFLRDRLTGTTERVSVADDESQADGISQSGQVSDDGRLVAFRSAATNLVAGASTGMHAYVRDRARGTTRRVDVSSGGVVGDGPVEFEQVAISASGNAVAFASLAGNLTAGDGNGNPDVYVRELPTGGALEWSVTPTRLGFGAVAVGERSAVQRVVVRNTGTTDLPLPWIAIIGQNRHQFDRIRRCPTVLAPGRSCAVDVWFAPTYPGAKAARLILSTEPVGEPKYVALSGWAN